MSEAKLKSQTKKAVTIQLDISLLQKIDKRAKKNYLTLTEKIEDILRRSMLSYNKETEVTPSEPEVDKFVKIFSKKRSGRKAKK